MGMGEISWHLPYSGGKPQETSARRPCDEGAVGRVIASNGVPFLQMRSVGSHSTSGREKEGKDRGRPVSSPSGLDLQIYLLYENLAFRITEKFSPRTIFEPGSPALLSDTQTN